MYVLSKKVPICVSLYSLKLKCCFVLLEFTLNNSSVHFLISQSGES